MELGFLADGLREAVGPTAAAFALAAIGLNVHYGYTGLWNVGQVGFMLVGAYGLAITTVTIGASFWLGVVVAVAASAVFALLLGATTLRLRADYLAITTVAAAEILRIVVGSGPARPITGGPFGLQSIATTFHGLNPFPARRFGTLGIEYSGTQLWMMVVTWGLVALFALLVYLLMRSPWGRVVRAVREDEDAARSLGKNAFAYKLQSLVLGGVMGGLGGMMFAIAGQNVSAIAFHPIQTFYLYAIVLLGGAATVFGPVAGTMIFFFLRAGLDAFLRSADFLPGFVTDQPGHVGAIVAAVIGLGLMALMAFRPQGTLGNREEMVLDA